MSIQVNQDLVKHYFEGKAKYSAYDTTVRIADHLKFHVDGYRYHDILKNKNNIDRRENPFFHELIDRRRPSEPVHIKEYRRDIYVPITKAPCFKVINSLKKIVKSEDWKITYNKSEKPKTVPENEQMEQYCEQDYPLFGSIENWAYSIALKELLSDPNAIVVVQPKTFDVQSNEYVKPFAYIIPSCKVYDYSQGEYIIYDSDKTYSYQSGKDVKKDTVKYVLDENSIWEIKRVNEKSWSITEVYQHNIGKLPAFRIGGTMEEVIDNSIIYSSFISPMLAGLDTAARESSDLDAEVVQNVFSTMWYIAGMECTSCKGVGSVKAVNKNGGMTTCPKCEGTGVMEKSPYKDIVIKKNFDDTNLPTPPAGYIEKSTEIVKIQDERVQQHIYRALSALNMEFLAQSPLNQSGVAKEVDRDELNNFVYGIAYHLVENILKPIYWLIGEYRYKLVVAENKVRYAMCPNIHIPEHYDLLSQEAVTNEIYKAKEAGVDALIMNELQVDLINKRFRDTPETRLKMLLVNKVNPFPTLSSTEVADLELGGSITQEDAVMSIYINTFVEEAIIEDKDFLEKELKDQIVVLKAKAAEKVKLLKPSEKVIDNFGQDSE